MFSKEPKDSSTYSPRHAFRCFLWIVDFRFEVVFSYMIPGKEARKE